MARYPFAEACRTTLSASDFIGLVEKWDGARSRFFRWGNVAKAAFDLEDSIKDILTLASVVESKLDGREAVSVLAHLSRRVNKMSQPDIAKALAEKALARSGPAGWDPWWDGGTRIEALRALQEVDPEGGQAKAVALFSEDLGDTLRSPLRLLVHFDEILPLLFGEVPELDVWAILEDYLEELYSAVTVEPVPEVENSLSGRPSEDVHDTAAQGVAVAVVTYLDHPSYVVASHAVSAAAAVLRAGTETQEMQQALITTFDHSEAAAERALVALEAASEGMPVILRPFGEPLYRLMSSSNIVIRTNATRLVNLLEGDFTTVPILDRDIPGIYELDLPQLSVFRTEKAVNGVDEPILLQDPARALRPLDIEARAVAKESGIDENAVLYRAAQFLEQFSRKRKWMAQSGKIDEQQLNQFLSNTGMRISFNKPHIEPAQRAIAYVVAELLDAGLLNIASAERLMAMFSRHDPSLVLAEPQPRPDWIHTIGGLPDEERVYSIPDRWVERADESLAYLRSRTPDGRIILAEYSRFAYLGTDKRIEEDRMSYIIAATEKELWQEGVLERGLLPYYRLIKSQAWEYASKMAPLEHLVIANEPHDIETPAAHWIALNPGIAQELEWRLSSDGLFRWVDESGDQSVESVWWRDGSLNRYDRHQDCSVGEGWIVVAAESIYRSFVDRAPSISRGGLVRRRIGFAGIGGSDYQHALLALP